MITSPLRDSFTLWGQSSPLCANFTPGGNPFAMSVLTERKAVQVTILWISVSAEEYFSDIAVLQGDQGSMLLSQFSPIFDHFRQKKLAFFSKNHVMIKILPTLALF
jgi:hypothetical protein